MGVAHHLGWAVAVTADSEHGVIDRRRIELVEPGLPPAPVHHEGGAHDLHRTGAELDDDALAELVARVRASAHRTAAAELDRLAADLGSDRPIDSLSLAAWPADFPADIATQRRPPHESRADSVMYRVVLAEEAAARGWAVHRYAKDVEAVARRHLAGRAAAILDGPRRALGPPWAKDHRTALAATVLAARAPGGARTA